MSNVNGWKVALGLAGMLVFHGAVAADAPASVAVSSAAGRPSASWALKGIGLGISPDDLRAKFANASCHGYPDPLIQTCSVPTTLAELPAELVVDFLRNQAVLVKVHLLTREQCKAGVLALQAKYGPPTKSEHNMMPSKLAHNGDVMFSDNNPRVRWDDGDVSLVEVPQEFATKDGSQHEAIMLYDKHKEFEDFWLRTQGKTTTKAADDL